MINKLLRIVAPHYCYGCQEIGSFLCVNCKYDINEDGFDGCIVCARPSSLGICTECHTSYDRAWCVGDRSGALERAIDAFKFERVSDAAGSLAELLDTRLPLLPSNVVIVPIPTIPKHIRQRGYDHTLRLAKEFARLRSFPLLEMLRRNDTKLVQLGNGKKQRMSQAERAFACDKELDSNVIYLLIDDVVTTNATVRFAAQTLKQAGAGEIWVAVLARQPLDKSA